ncbi:MAG: mannonate dehydratase [Pseudomonadota bacterium]
MIECWRWYGPYDKISLAEIRQTGATGIVTALHEVPYGEPLTREAIAVRKAQIEAEGLTWEVVESLPVHERIKRGDGDLTQLFANYCQSMTNLAAEGLKVICYNFMPLVDWTRTDLTAPVLGGGTCLRFDTARMCAFEMHRLGRQAADTDYPAEVRERAAVFAQTASDADWDTLLNAIMAGLPGAYDRYDVEGLRAGIASYNGIDRTALRANFQRFLEAVIPTAEKLGIRMCVHPDDPPRDILGLPRIVSSAEDIAWLLDAVPSPANGLTLCSGSLGAGPGNDLPAIARQFGQRIYFAHLRNVRKFPDGSFEEAAHLDGDTDMVALCTALLEAERAQGISIPFRPDHGHALLDDADRDTHPGYPLIGRMRGLAELRGVIRALLS